MKDSEIPVVETNPANQINSVQKKEQESNVPDSKEKDNQTATTKKRFTIFAFLILIASLVFLTISCSFYYIDFEDGLIDEVAKFTAHAFWLGIVSLFFLRGSSQYQKRIVFFVFAFILSSITCYSSVNLLYEARNAKKAKTRMASIIDDIMENKSVSEVEESYGELTPTIHFLTDWINEIQQVSATMYDELDKCNLKPLFDVKTLTQINLLLQYQSSYEKAGKIITKYEDLLTARLNAFPLRVENSSLAENQKQRLIAGFNTNKEDSFHDMTFLLQVRKNYVSEANKLLAFMIERYSHYKYRDSKIMFDFQEDVNIFMEYQQNLLNLLQQEDFLIEKIKQEGFIKLNEINELTK